MNKSSKTLISCLALGLNINTGTSGKISFKHLEAHTSLRQNSNGSRIIRTDDPLFKLFNFQFSYDEDTGAIQSVEFKGYKTTTDKVQAIQNHITKLSTKLLNIENLIAQEIENIKILTKQPSDYTRADLDKLEWWK